MNRSQGLLPKKLHIMRIAHI